MKLGRNMHKGLLTLQQEKILQEDKLKYFSQLFHCNRESIQILGIDILGKLILGIENEIFKKRFIVSNIVSLQFTKEESFLLQ